MKILGISAFYHDSAAALIVDGKIVAAAQEERFTRIRHDAAFPIEAIKWCLSDSNLELKDIDKITFYEDPGLKFKRLLKTYVDYFPKTIPLFFNTFLPWYTKKRDWRKVLSLEFEKGFGVKLDPAVFFNIEHHLSHAASAFLPSNFNEAAILIMDGVGEFASTSIWKGSGSKIELVEKVDFPNSIGLLYSALTYYTGFKVNSGEYKVMGLAPYGVPRFKELIKKHLIKINDDGTYQLDMDYFSFQYSNYMTNDKFHDLFGGPPRTPESQVTQKEMDIARSLQEVTEELVLNLAHRALKKCDTTNLCLAGGVALNCVANGKIVNQVTKNIWIQPAAGDAGGSLGSALYYYFSELNNTRNIDPSELDMMQGSYLGPSYSSDETEEALKKLNAIYRKYDFNELKSIVVDKLIEENVVGWFQGKMEFGPRALGNRSIIGDARSPFMQKIMNLKIKFRESFRPFAPAVLAEKVSEYFKLDIISPYMLLVSDIKDHLKIEVDDSKYFGIEKLNAVRSKVPAITHVDHSARIQSVHLSTNKEFYELLDLFNKKSGSGILINTSFNVRGEPIVCTVEEAYRCFMRTGIDVLVVNDFVLFKTEQKDFEDNEKWMQMYELD
jgi:carbamoyltransferase